MAVNSFREDEQVKSQGKWKVIVRLFSYLKEHANVIEEAYEADGIHVTAECSEADMGRLSAYIKQD